MQKKYNVYPNLGYWFLLIILLVFGGYYNSYFSTLFRPKPTIIHIHFALMALWIMMVIIQPFLIKNKKLHLHRLVGKFSYVLVPLLLLSTLFIIRYSFYNGIDRLKAGSAPSTTPVSYDEAARISVTEGLHRFMHVICWLLHSPYSAQQWTGYFSLLLHWKPSLLAFPYLPGHFLWKLASLDCCFGRIANIKTNPNALDGHPHLPGRANPFLCPERHSALAAILYYINKTRTLII